MRAILIVVSEKAKICISPYTELVQKTLFEIG